MKTAIKIPPNQLNFETDAAAVLYGEDTVKDQLDRLTAAETSDFGKKILAARNETELRRLLRVSDEDILDECQNRWSFSKAAITSAQAKFGEKSLAISNGTAVTVSPIVFGSKFTINFWLYTGTSVATNTWIFRALNGAQSFGIKYNIISSSLYLQVGTGSDLSTVTRGYSGGTKSAWKHIEIGYDGSKLYFFYGGVISNVGTGAVSLSRVGRKIYLGQSAGYIDDFRLLDGVCLHTAAFTPPSAPYSAENNAAYLKSLVHFD